MLATGGLAPLLYGTIGFTLSPSAGYASTGFFALVGETRAYRVGDTLAYYCCEGAAVAAFCGVLFFVGASLLGDYVTRLREGEAWMRGCLCYFS